MNIWSIINFFFIKSQLRNKLVTELQQTTKGNLTERTPREAEEGSLLHRASNSLVADHLRHCKYDYSLSVFLPESSTQRDKVSLNRGREYTSSASSVVWSKIKYSWLLKSWLTNFWNFNTFLYVQKKSNLNQIMIYLYSYFIYNISL